MDVLRLIEFFQHKIHGFLMNAIASDDGHGLPQSEELGVTRAPEADVVGGQRPAHDGRTTFDAERQKTVEHGIIDA